MTKLKSEITKMLSSNRSNYFKSEQLHAMFVKEMESVLESVKRDWRFNIYTDLWYLKSDHSIAFTSKELIEKYLEGKELKRKS